MTFSFFINLNVIILFLKAEKIFRILLIFSLICVKTCIAILFFKRSMMFLSKCFIITFKSQIDDFSIFLFFVFEANFETKLMMIEINVRRL